MALISINLNKITESPTLAIVKKVQDLKNRGIDILSLSAGEPYFDTPINIKNAAIDAILLGKTKYTNVDGTKELKNAVRQKYLRDNNLEYELDQIIISNGGKQVIYNLFMASLDEADEVIIPSPYWVSYPDIVKLANGNPIIVPCSINHGFKYDLASLATYITPKTKWIILNSPNNPTGSVYTEYDLQKFAEFLRNYPHVNIMSDDIYEHIIFDNKKFYNLAIIAPDLKNRIFIVNGVSKSYSMTGWRIGYGVGDKTLIKAMTIIQSQATSNPCSISQAAAAEALNGPQDFIKSNNDDFEEKRNIAFSILSKSKYLECFKPEGAFYLFVKCQNLFGKITKNGNILNNSNDVAEYLLDHASVAVVPGSAFGEDNYFRISYATSSEILTKACNNIITSINNIN
jgi:aspartate aminotransferase